LYNRIIKKLRQKLSFNRKSAFVLNKSIDSSFVKEDSVEIINTNITLIGKSELIIHENVSIDGYNIHLDNSSLNIGKHSQLIKGQQYFNPTIFIDKGKLIIGAYNIIKASLIVRFGGECSIGTYNAINEETEIRCDQSVTIGDYNMISYECMIYDTNTHCIYPPEIRRETIKADFPIIGIEREKPNTKAVVIGNDNWLGKRSVILKGCILGNQVIVGAQAVVSNLKADKGVVVGNPAYIVSKKSNPGESQFDFSD
jgi:acetyltransferase-like isoleucine patch superfamily enzyme